METLISAFLRSQRNQRRLMLENLSAKVGMLPQHLLEIESGKRDPRLSSIERMAEAMGMTVLIVPDAVPARQNSCRLHKFQRMGMMM